MEIKTFRAKTMQQALDLVRNELGSEATVLHTRELNSGLVNRLLKGRQFEIAASAEVEVPTRMSRALAHETTLTPVSAGGVELDCHGHYHDDFHRQSGGVEGLHALADQLHHRSAGFGRPQLPETMFHAFTDMIELDVEESVAQELIERVSRDPRLQQFDSLSIRAELARLLERELVVSGPIEAGAGQGRVVALVGSTGVGKTTTIAKLAANYRLRENKRVGLITVDTYRIAAVEQLRTYADIIDLPMEVVATPREMREAIDRMSELDLVLMDTAGRSPRDEIKIQELKSMLSEAEPDEVHLVLSAVSGARSLVSTAEQFATVGTTSMIVTKLDEATGLGNLLSVMRACRLPISYLTDGQNVPDDIQVATSSGLAEMILGIT